MEGDHRFHSLQIVYGRSPLTLLQYFLETARVYNRDQAIKLLRDHIALTGSYEAFCGLKKIIESARLMIGSYWSCNHITNLLDVGGFLTCLLRVYDPYLIMVKVKKIDYKVQLRRELKFMTCFASRNWRICWGGGLQSVENFQPNGDKG